MSLPFEEIAAVIAYIDRFDVGGGDAPVGRTEHVEIGLHKQVPRCQFRKRAEAAHAGPDERHAASESSLFHDGTP